MFGFWTAMKDKFFREKGILLLFKILLILTNNHLKKNDKSYRRGIQI